MPDSQQTANGTAKSRLRRIWTDYCRPLLVVLAIMIPFRSSIADWNDVPTGSMKPTILEGDRIFVNKLAYDLKIPLTTRHLAQWSDPRRGDIVVCDSPADGKRLVKRVIGIPGDILNLSNNHLHINGRAVDYTLVGTGPLSRPSAQAQPGSVLAWEQLDGAPHLVMGTPGVRAMRSFNTLTVPAGSYFVMGDNRDNSADSRYFGFVQREKIVGRAKAIVMSLDREKWFTPRRSRFFKKMD